jgi:cell division protein YceG involved in septum cleavage|tara:strand:+ start:3012 stop:3398 length:387 start_codon:yes stop_codon:yes gene_type:complete
MGNSETFGVQKGYGEEIVTWLNEQSKIQNNKLEARLYNYEISTKNFGDFEMFSWMGDVQIARKMIIKASKKFKIKVIEGGYKPKEKLFKMKKFDFAKVKKGNKTIGQLEFAVSRLGNAQWEIQDEERH